MGKTSKWISNLLLGKKDKGGGGGGGGGGDTPSTPHASTSRLKKRWSFRKSGKGSNMMDCSTVTNSPKLEKKNGVMSTKASFDTTRRRRRQGSGIEEVATIMIQSAFRSHLAKKALRALKGLVKLQATVRGHLVRKRAATTLRCMQALLSVQARARARRILLAEDTELTAERLSIYRKSYDENQFKQLYDMNRAIEDNIKIVEMDLGETEGTARRRSRRRHSHSAQLHFERGDRKFLPHYQSHSKHDHQNEALPSPSNSTNISQKAGTEYSGVLQADYVSNNGQTLPNYMAKTESSKAKARSQSAPKQRPLYERQLSKRKGSGRMQRSSSHVGSIDNGYQFQWSMNLDRSTTSLKDSECGSTNTVFTNTKSLYAYEVGDYY